MRTIWKRSRDEVRVDSRHASRASSSSPVDGLLLQDEGRERGNCRRSEEPEDLWGYRAGMQVYAFPDHVACGVPSL